MTSSPNALELRDFIAALARELRTLDQPEIVEKLERANRYFLMPLTSEFLGEAMAALQDAVNTGLLPPSARRYAVGYIKTIKLSWFSPRKID